MSFPKGAVCPVVAPFCFLDGLYVYKSFGPERFSLFRVLVIGMLRRRRELWGRVIGQMAFGLDTYQVTLVQSFGLGRIDNV